MKTAMRKGAARMLAALMCVVMLLGMVPVSAVAAEESPEFDRIVHLDMGRKYFTPDWIKRLIDEISALGYNQLELDFGNSEAGQFRFALDDMDVTYTYVEQHMVPVVEEPAVTETPGVEPSVEPTVEPTAAPSVEPTVEPTAAPSVEPTAAPTTAPSAQPSDPVGDVMDDVMLLDQQVGSSGGVMEFEYVNVPVEKTVDLRPALGQSISETEMEEILSYAQDKGVEIVPLLNTPGHMGAILEGVLGQKDFRYRGSNSLDITSPEARAFGMAVVEKYASWFMEHGCTTFNIGADEFANDIYSSGGMGFEHLVSAGKYHYFVSYVNELAGMLQDMGYQVRAFNDGICYAGQRGVDTSIEVCYWTPGWGGYRVASAETLAREGYSLVNTNGEYYYVLGKDSSMTNGTVDAEDFRAEDFAGGSRVLDPAGAMFCIWCDVPAAQSEDEVMKGALPYMTGFASALVTSVTDEATNVTVKAPGVSKITTAAAAVESLPQGSYVAYDVQLNDGAYQGAAQVTLPLGTLVDKPDSQLMGFVVNKDGTLETASGTKQGNSFTFTAPHFSVVGVMARAEAQQITVTVGKNYGPVQIDGIYAEENVVIMPEGIVNVRLEAGKGGDPVQQETIQKEQNYYIGNGTQFIKVSGNQISSTTNLEEATQWTAVQSGSNWKLKMADGSMYLSDQGRTGNKSLTLVEGDGNAREWEYGANGFCFEEGVIIWRTTYYIDYDGGWTVKSRGGNATGRAYLPGGDPNSTSVFFTGVTPGSATVTIGGTYVFDVTVQEKALEIQNECRLEFWNTNSNVKGTNSKDTYLDLKSNNVPASIYTENGTALTELAGVPQEGTNGDGNNVVFWKGTMLTGGTREHGDMADKPNPSWRKHYDGWQCGCGGQDHTMDENRVDFDAIRYSVDTDQWSVRDMASGEWKAVASNNQLVVYYLQVTELTQAMQTQIKDWGLVKGQPNNWFNWGASWALSVAVVYDGTMVPSERNLVDTSTFYNGDRGRNIGYLRFLESNDWEIEYITATPGTHPKRGDGTSIDVEYDVDNPRIETKIWDRDTEGMNGLDSGSPYVWGGDPEFKDVLTWNDNKNAILIRIYVKAKVHEDSLKIQYVDDTAGNYPFYDLPINVQEGVNFTGYVGNNGELLKDTITLSSGDPFTIQTDLMQLTFLPEKYKSGLYQYSRAEVSADNTTLILHYTLSQEVHTFIADYGSVMNITPSDLGISNVGSFTVGADSNGLTAQGSNLSFQMPDLNFTGDLYSVTAHFTDGGTSTVYLRVYPASTVYYEAEDFVTASGWTKAGQSDSRTQAADKLGDAQAHNYGSDPSYKANGTTWSNGNALSTEVVQKNGTSWPSAQFTFTGTGADIISQTDNTSCMLLVKVTDEGGLGEKAYLVNNYYSGEPGIHQVPVIKIDGLSYGTHTVTVTPFHNTLFDQKEQSEFTFYLDAIRVYEPMGQNGNAQYAKDGEAIPVFVNLRKCVTIAANGLWVDSNANATVEEYNRVGPNHEIYLAAGQSVTVTLDRGSSNAQIGARVMEGSTGTISVDSKTISVKGGTDQYYRIEGGVGTSVTITNTGNTCIALTTLKLTDSSY